MPDAVDAAVYGSPVHLTRPVSGFRAILIAGVLPIVLAMVVVVSPAPSGSDSAAAAHRHRHAAHQATHHRARHHHTTHHRARHHRARHHHGVRHHHATRHVLTHFRIGSFNVLGSQHTVGRGGWGPGRVRARVTARLVAHRRLDVVGMQEVQPDQLHVLRTHMHGYRFWPGASLGYPGVPLQIGWRTHRFERVGAGKIHTPFDHQRRPVPWVLLRDRVTQRTVYVVDIHNSAGPQERSRDAATRHEIRLIRKLRHHHRPVFVLGDMNEKSEWFCRVVGKTDLRAANGGSVHRGHCRPPANPRIDWVMGSGPVRFSQYHHDQEFPVRFASDHDLVRALVTMRTTVGHRHHQHRHAHTHRHHRPHHRHAHRHQRHSRPHRHQHRHHHRH